MSISPVTANDAVWAAARKIASMNMHQDSCRASYGPMWRCDCIQGTAVASLKAALDDYDNLINSYVDALAGPRCKACNGRGTKRGARCGCGPYVSHVVDCGTRPRPCPECDGTGLSSDTA